MPGSNPDQLSPRPEGDTVTGPTQHERTDRGAAEFPAVRGIDVSEVADRMMGDRELFYLALRALRDEFGDVVPQLRSDAACGHRGKVAARMHKLAGLAGNVSARTVAVLACDLEASFSEDPSADEERLLGELERAIAEIVADLPRDIDDAPQAPNG